VPTYTIDGETPDNKGKLEHLSGSPYPALPASTMVPTPTPPEVAEIKNATYIKELSAPPKTRGTMGPPLGTPDNYIVGVELSQRGLAYVKNGCEDSPLLDVAILCIAVQPRTPGQLFEQVQLQYKRSTSQSEIAVRMVALAQKGWLTLVRHGKKAK
jgi:hypothetical protein